MKRIAVVLCVVLLAGCSLLFEVSIEEAILGAWVMDSDPGYYIRFFKGGTMQNSDGQDGTWSIDDDMILLTWEGGGSSYLGVVVVDDTMILTQGVLQFSFTRL